MPLGKRLQSAALGQRHRHGRSQEWLSRINVVDFLEALNIDNIAHTRKDEITFSCPFDGHKSADSRPSAFMNTGEIDHNKTTAWMCHGCGRAGNAIGFLAEHRGITKQESAVQLRMEYAPDFRAPKEGIAAEFEQRLSKRAVEAPRSNDMPTIPFADYERLFAVDWEDAEQQWESRKAPPEVAYMFNRGFTVDTLISWDIGYDHYTDRITIPIRDAIGQIVGVKARTWKTKSGERVKYLILGDKEGRHARYGFTHYEKSRVVFGLHRALGSQSVVLVEGELDVLALSQICAPAISTGSAHLSSEQSLLIRDNFEEVTVFFDTNTAGINATRGWFDKDGGFHKGVIQMLEPFIHVKIVEDHDHDASDMVGAGRVDALESLIAAAIPSHQLQVERTLL